MKKSERQLDLLKIISQLDIPPSLYHNACQKYESIAKYLESHGLQANIYPQGSFALGTVIRPYSKDKERNYDLDFICQVTGSRDDISPSELRNQIADILNNSDLYGGKLTEYAECFTIEYADINGIGFSIDIVPATNESASKKAELYALSKQPWLIDTAIAIPRHSQLKAYNWITNNPKGYCKWFSGINAPFAAVSAASYREALFESHRDIYASIEQVPSELERTSMQRVIQILKYHRDVYYSNISGDEDLKPISSIINTVVAEIANSANPHWSVFELLQYVVNELAIYAQHQNLSSNDFTNKYGERNVFTRFNGIWKIENPANPKDNLADKWNTNPEIPKRFFLWAAAVKDQLIDSLDLDDETFRAKAETAFGYNVVSTAWNNKYNPVKPKPVSTAVPSRPWRTL